jgi:hypothetical protein
MKRHRAGDSPATDAVLQLPAAEPTAQGSDSPQEFPEGQPESVATIEAPLDAPEQAQQSQQPVEEEPAFPARRGFTLQPVPGCAIKLTEPQVLHADEEEDAVPEEFSDALPCLDLNDEELSLAGILPKLPVSDQNTLLKTPCIKGAVRWPNSKAFKEHIDGRDLQVCLIC